MIERKRFALNRILFPEPGLEEFYRLAADAGLSKVELRNDLHDGRIIDGLPAAKAAALAQRYGIRIITINALQKFNLKAMQAKVMKELENMLALAADIHCTALILCPNNDVSDKRDMKTRLAETVEALKSFGPLFMKRGMLGFVEPLGFGSSSLSSVATAVEAVKSSGFSCYRIVHDTFHHYLGPDTEQTIGSSYDVSNIGLIHVSGVESDIPKEKCRDEHRLFPSAADRTFCKAQIDRHDRLGYTGDISFEPFSPEVQSLPRDELLAAIKRSMEFLAG